jgi:hypothetical protein
MVVDLGELDSRNRRGSPGAPGWNRRCAGWSRIVARPGWRGGPVASSTQRCAMWAALERAIWPAVDGCLFKRPTYGHFSSFSSEAVCALATFVPGEPKHGRSEYRRRPLFDGLLDMPRGARKAPGEQVYHVLKRSAGAMHLSRNDADFEALQRGTIEARH